MIDVVCGVIEDGDGRVLACLREGGHLAGCWEFPGGKVEEGESEEDALKRELSEELGIVVEVGAAMAPVPWNYGDRTIRLLPYRCRILSGEPRPLEHEKVVWCAPYQLADLVWAPADLPVLDEFLHGS